MITSNGNLLMRRVDGVIVFTLTRADMIDPELIRQIGDEINSRIKTEESPRVVVDFGCVRFLSSAALGMMVALHKMIEDRNGAMHIANVAEEIMGVFRLTRLQDLIPVHDTTEEAVRGLTR